MRQRVSALITFLVLAIPLGAGPNPSARGESPGAQDPPAPATPNPSSALQLQRAQQLLGQKKPREAADILRPITEREPQNARA